MKKHLDLTSSKLTVRPCQLSGLEDEWFRKKNAHFQGQHVNLPEGKSPFSYGFPMIFPWFLLDSRLNIWGSVKICHLPSECDCDPTLGYLLGLDSFSKPMGLWGIDGLEGR